jgi:hypothetical protein
MDISYLYFGSRLMDLYEELENPKPHGWIEKLMERKSAARYVMMATLVRDSGLSSLLSLDLPLWH